MRVLIALTYYRPHISGLTIQAERMGVGLARRGHQVTVLTSQYDPSLPLHETLNGVDIIRGRIIARVSKGVLMPAMGWLATKLVLSHDVISIQVPQFDAFGIAARARLLRRPVVMTYNCDLKMPPGLLNQVANRVVDGTNLLAATFSDRIITHSQDFADHSPFLQRFRSKTGAIYPSIETEQVTPEDIASFRNRWALGSPTIAMVARLAAEKGVEYLIQALPKILQVYPHARVMYAGQHENVLGEEAYARRLAPLIEQYRDNWTFMGRLSDRDLAAFMSCCDVFVTPSLNSTESFGMAQAEAMLCGAPCVASNLPGVRQPILQTGMGEVIPPANSDALAEAILKVLDNRTSYVRPRQEVAKVFSTEVTVDQYEALFHELVYNRMQK